MAKTDTAAPAADHAGLVIRPYAGEADLREIVRVTNAEYAVDDIRERVSLDDLAATFRHVSDSFDPGRDVLMAELDDEVVGTVRINWVDTTDGNREYSSRGAVDPAHRRRGIGRRLLREAVVLARARATEHETDRPRVVGMWTDEKQPGALALAHGEGYSQVRWFFEMERAGLDGDLPELLPLPAGLEVRPARAGDARSIWDADHDAFRDHWGGFDASQASMQRWVESSEFRPELFVVAWDGDEIAGAVLNAIYADENEELGLRRGWLDSVFTRRAWRGRGLARALIGRSLRLLAQRGMDTAALGVDADNPSGALGLCQSAGFAVTERSSAWRKPMEGAS